MKEKLMELLHNSPLEVSINMMLRYDPVVKKLEEIKQKNKNIKVLEIGSGSKGITRFFKYPVTGIDIEFQKHKSKYLREIKIAPNKKYTFKDNEFDVVVSVDTIEHIPRKKRKKTLEEIKRVSKKHVIITCPFEISRWDRRVLKKWSKNSATYRNIKEHCDCKIPKPKEIESVFKGCNIKMTFGEHPALAYYIKLAESNIFGKLFSRSILKIFMPVFLKIRGRNRRYYFIEKV